MREKEYQRLTRPRPRSAFSVGFISRSSLWLGEDHLLCVDSGGYTETYKRFYFRDIQAVSIQRTDRHHWWSGILGSLAFIFFIITVGTVPKTAVSQWSYDQITGGIILSGITGFFLLLVLINLYLGPACKCYLRTAVQTEELPSLSRVRRARRALDRLRSFITTVQGELAPEDVAARMRESVQSSDFKVQSPEPNQPAESQP